jgi:fructose-1,6-bisphosphatase/inositol monophosphatase family enzyme
MDVSEIKDFLGFAVDAAIEAGRITKEYFLESIDVDTKTDDTPVTEADRMAEVHVRERIEEVYQLTQFLERKRGKKGKILTIGGLLTRLMGLNPLFAESPFTQSSSL